MIAVLGLASLLALQGCTGGELPSGPPNIVVIISDDHGWPDYGFMGHPVVQTPNLDRLASESLAYTRGYVPAPLCRPSLATIATGLYPHQHGITGNDPPGETLRATRTPEARASMERVFAQNDSVMELLARSGYVSHQSGKWWEGNPTSHGFTAAMTHGDVSRRGRHGDDGLAIGREGMQPIFDFVEFAVLGPAAEFIVEYEPKPFFVWYAPFLPHTPHNPPDRLLDQYRLPERPERVASYYAMVAWFDETVGQLLDFLDSKMPSQTAPGLPHPRIPSNLDRLKETVVLYVADNGWLPTENRADQATARAKMSPYELGVRTPIMVRWPGKVEPRRDDTTLVSSIDLVPTILEVAGIEPPLALPGVSLLDREALSRRKQVFGATFAHTAVDVLNPVANLKYRSVVREDGWKLIQPYEPNKDVTMLRRGDIADWMRFNPELYNVIEDPAETQNLAADRPELVTELRAALRDWWMVPGDTPAE